MKSRDGPRVSVHVNGEPWRNIVTLADAGPDDRVFALDAASGTITFGDGAHGKVPAAGDSVTVTYRSGSGAASNVHLSISTRWPPPSGQYTITTAATGLRISTPKRAD